VARVARRMGDVSTNAVSVFDIPHPPFGHLPPPGEGKTKSNWPYAIALPSGGRTMKSGIGASLPRFEDARLLTGGWSV